MAAWVKPYLQRRYNLRGSCLAVSFEPGLEVEPVIEPRPLLAPADVAEQVLELGVAVGHIRVGRAEPGGPSSERHGVTGPDRTSGIHRCAHDQRDRVTESVIRGTLVRSRVESGSATPAATEVSKGPVAGDCEHEDAEDHRRLLHGLNDPRECSGAGHRRPSTRRSPRRAAGRRSLRRSVGLA